MSTARPSQPDALSSVLRTVAHHLKREAVGIDEVGRIMLALLGEPARFVNDLCTLPDRPRMGFPDMGSARHHWWASAADGLCGGRSEDEHGAVELPDHPVDVPEAVAQHDSVGGLSELVDVTSGGAQQPRRV